jgi:hypothetical protein
VRNIGDSPSRTAQSGGESEEGRRPAPLGRARGEGRGLAACLVRVRGPSPRTKQREPMCSQDSALLSKGSKETKEATSRLLVRSQQQFVRLALQELVNEAGLKMKVDVAAA